MLGFLGWEWKIAFKDWWWEWKIIFCLDVVSHPNRQILGHCASILWLMMERPLVWSLTNRPSGNQCPWFFLSYMFCFSYTLLAILLPLDHLSCIHNVFSTSDAKSLSEAGTAAGDPVFLRPTCVAGADDRPSPAHLGRQTPVVDSDKSSPRWELRTILYAVCKMCYRDNALNNGYCFRSRWTTITCSCW